jgi:hypothetical protein
MSQISKEKALETLNRHIEQSRKIEQTLKATGSICQQCDFDLTKLRTDTKTSLIHIFGEQSRQLHAITCLPTSIYYHGQQTYLQRFRATLSSIVDEIREYWDNQTAADMITAVQGVASEGKANNVPVAYDSFKLLWNITTHFDMNDIENMCFGMHIDFDSIRGEEKTSKARELIMYCERNGELIAVCLKLRPNVA